jgi:hypothetical protein
LTAEALADQRKIVEVVVAMDEYFTFAETEQQQQDKIRMICGLATDFVISTIKDYKNQDFKDREFSIPALIRSGTASRIYNEFHDWDLNDRSSWETMVYEIENPQGTMQASGPFDRRTMYFKQLAKFTADAGARSFTVHKNLMYKSLIKKNYEHVASVRFE